MQKIIPHLWYDKEAKEAALFYVSIFDQSKILDTTVIEGTPSGDAEMVSFQLAGQQFNAISAGPYFQFNPSISLMVACSTAEEVNAKWKALTDGGSVLMPLGEYPFSKWYGWTQDRYGLSWQLMLVDEEASLQKITPNFLFSNQVCGKAEEDEAFSLMVNCDDQKEIDYFWDKLSAVPEAEQCGWLKDKFGVSWQIAPSNLDVIMYHGSKEEVQRVTEAFLKMKKFDLEVLVQARLGNQ